MLEQYFADEDALWRLLDTARARATGDHDVLLMYSGGKDSTYVLGRLVERGYRVLAVTFDNGYVPEACFANIRTTCAALGVESLVLELGKPRMNRVFKLSLERDADVCTGCYRALTARGTETALARGIPIVMTGLSRGQIFETKLLPLIAEGIDDVDELETCLALMRRAYHARGDEVGELVGDTALANHAGFDALQFVDFFRYSAVPKQAIEAFIAERLPAWSKPDNVGSCSSNCMINDVGIAVHLDRRGYHSYAVSVSAEIRFGHETREHALAELDAPLDRERIKKILRVIEAS
jgi:hypothetical protein